MEESLSSIIGKLRILAAKSNITPSELKNGKALAARCYLSHNKREITLNTENYQLVVDILRIKDD